MGILLQRTVAMVRARVLLWAPSQYALRFEDGEER